MSRERGSEPTQEPLIEQIWGFAQVLGLVLGVLIVIGMIGSCAANSSGHDCDSPFVDYVHCADEDGLDYGYDYAPRDRFVDPGDY